MQGDGAAVARLAHGDAHPVPVTDANDASASRSHSSMARRPVRASSSTTSSRVSTRRSPTAKQCRSWPRSSEAEAPSVIWRVLVVVGGISVALLGACGDDDGGSANAEDSAPPTPEDPPTPPTTSVGPPACIDGARPLDIGGGRVAAVHGDGPSAVVLVNQIED